MSLLGRPSISRTTLAGFSGDAEWQPTFAFRVGWPTRPAAASPRRSLASVVMARTVPIRDMLGLF